MSFERNNLSFASPSTVTQIDLELLYSKYQTHQCIAHEFTSANADTMLLECGIPASFGIDLLVQMVLHKRANITTLIGLLRKHFEAEENPAQACADMLHKAIEQDVVDFDSMAQVFVMKWDIPAATHELMDQFQYPLPMVDPPRKVTHNRQTGYCTIPGSLLLRNNHHDKDICLDHINRVNQVPLALNANVVAFIQNSWKNLDRQKADETAEDFEKRKRAFAKYDRVSRDVLQGLMAMGNRFWLTHRYDKRGRTYCQGYHVTTQGNQWNKACVEFADKEPLNQE